MREPWIWTPARTFDQELLRFRRGIAGNCRHPSRAAIPANPKRHQETRGAESVTVKHNEGEIAKGGCVVVNDRFELTDLIEKPAGPAPSPWYNAGVYTFCQSIFEFTAKLKLSPRGEYELTDAIRDLAKSGQLVKAIELSGDWADVRDPEVLAALNR